MDAQLKISDEELIELIEVVKHNPKLAGVYWQLRGYWMVGGDDPASFSTEN